MENRIALISIIVSDTSVTEAMNKIMHGYASYIIGRMGLPYAARKIALISLAMDAPIEVINALCGQLGRLPGLKVKAVYTKE